MAFLEIDRSEKRFGSVEILKGIDLDARGGRLPGAGRPVGLRQVHAAQHDRRAGDDHRGRDPHRRPQRSTTCTPRKRDIAMVFQSYALYPNMTVAENIAFGMEMRGVPKEEREKAIDEVAKMLQIDHLLERKPSQLSGGQRQRVAMGRALVRDPQALPVRRAAVQPRRQAARRHAHRDQAAARNAPAPPSSMSRTTRSRR